MRGRNYKRRKTGQHGRRLLLASLLVASGQFAGAETPIAMVPLPLTPLESGSAGIRSNPFCQPVAVETASVQPRYLAESAEEKRPQAWAGLGAVSGNTWQQSGAANDLGVVLTSGGQSQPRNQSAGGGEGLRSYLQAPIIEAAGGVRANPLATQFKATDPPEPKVDIAGVRAFQRDAEKSKKSSAISFSFSDEDPSDDPVGPPGASEPIEFSLSDDSAISVDEEIVDKSSGSSTPPAERPITRPTAVWPGAYVERAPGGLPEPVNLRALEPAQFSTNRILQVPTPESVEMAAEEPIVQLKPLDVFALSPDENRLVNGGHPRIEVGRPTVAVDRLATMSLVAGKPRVLTVETESAEELAPVQASLEKVVIAVDETVENAPLPPQVTKMSKGLQSVLSQDSQLPSAQSPRQASSDPQSKAGLTGADAALPEPTQAVPETAEEVKEIIVASFNLKPTEVRAIKIDSSVTQVQSDNLAVCAAIQVASGQIQLIATGSGTTRLSVHTVGKDGVEKTDRYEVTVGEVRSSAVDSLESIAMTLTQTVQSAFPGSNVLVSAEAGRLIVSGSCPDEDSARRMLRMIRSACATPVVDRVMVR